MTTLATPDLVVDGGSGPMLRCRRCGRCGALSFPPQHYGCEACGAPDTDRVEELVAPHGSVLARATVQRDVFGHPVPYTVVEVALDAGPVVRVLAFDERGEGLEIGGRVRGVLAPTGERRGEDDVLGLVIAADERTTVDGAGDAGS